MGVLRGKDLSYSLTSPIRSKPNIYLRFSVIQLKHSPPQAIPLAVGALSGILMATA